jgi:hypothetical protein
MRRVFTPDKSFNHLVCQVRSVALVTLSNSHESGQGIRPIDGVMGQARYPHHLSPAVQELPFAGHRCARKERHDGHPSSDFRFGEYAAVPRQVSDAIKEVARREFKGEVIAWAAQPDPRRAARGSMGHLWFGIPWAAFAFFWEYMAIQTATAGNYFMPVFGAPFVIAGICMIGAPAWAWYRAPRVYYVLTDKRLVILKTSRVLKLTSLLPRNILSIERTERSDGSGDIKLVMGWISDSEGGKTEKSETLYGIAEARRVEEQIREVMERSRA